MRRAVRLVASLVAILLAVAAVTIALAQQPSMTCSPQGALTPLKGLSEASGLALSRSSPGRLWTHNDSGQPVLFAIDASGGVAGQVRVAGASVEDWEAVAVGPCGTGSCLYVGDIGDNEARRPRITVYRVPEPAGTSGTATVSGVFHATYPDGAHDAETLLAGADGRLYIVTKGETGPLAIYRFPAQLQDGQTMRLERIGAASGQRDAASRITDGAVSPDGHWVVLRSRSALTFYRGPDLLGGQWRAAASVDLRSMKEPQGEGVAYGPDNTVFLAGEGGGKGQPGTFARLACRPAE